MVAKILKLGLPLKYLSNFWRTLEMPLITNIYNNWYKTLCPRSNFINSTLSTLSTWLYQPYQLFFLSFENNGVVEQTQPANIGPPDVPRTSPSNVLRTSSKDPTWPSQGHPNLTSRGRPNLTSWGSPKMTSDEVDSGLIDLTR